MKNNKIITLLILIAAIGLAACNRADSEKVKGVTIDEFEQLIKTNGNAIILDVRTPGEYAAGHLANSVLININDPDFTERVDKLDKSAPVLVYCASGIRSAKAADIMADQGFSTIYHMEDGLREWIKSNKPVVQ